MENIINSFFIKQSRITELTFEFTERLWIQSVQYEVSTVEHIPYIATTGGRNKLYKLEENPDVTKYGEDLYHIRSIMKDSITAEDVEINVMYQIDKATRNVFKVSHLYVAFEDGTKKILYNETAETYMCILRTLQTRFPELVSGLFVKIGNDYKYFLDIEL